MDYIGIYWIVFLVLYFLPSIIAFGRYKKNTAAIFVLNLLLGFTIIGWVVALIWSLMYEDRRIS